MIYLDYVSKDDEVYCCRIFCAHEENFNTTSGKITDSGISRTNFKLRISNWYEMGNIA